jgi:hypothetical protein
MNKKCCSNCAHFELPKNGYICGTCEFPLPEFLGSTFLNNPDINGSKCKVYKDKDAEKE